MKFDAPVLGKIFTGGDCNITQQKVVGCTFVGVHINTNRVEHAIFNGCAFVNCRVSANSVNFVNCAMRGQTKIKANTSCNFDNITGDQVQIIASSAFFLDVNMHALDGKCTSTHMIRVMIGDLCLGANILNATASYIGYMHAPKAKTMAYLDPNTSVYEIGYHHQSPIDIRGLVEHRRIINPWKKSA